MKESKEMRFRRVAQSRVNKIIEMLHLLGNCSNLSTYTYNSEQVTEIFEALQAKLDQTKKRFMNPNQKRFSLTNEQDIQPHHFPEVILPLPDGTSLRAIAYSDTDYPAIRIYWEYTEKESDEICFAEYNHEQSSCHKLCIGVYQFDQDEPAYYKPYMAERNSI